MRKQAFRTEELKRAFEREMDCRLRSFSRLGGGGRAVNFRAVREGDGLACIVKCYPLQQFAAYDRLRSNLMTMAGARVPKVLFADRYPLRIADCWVLCLLWCTGSPNRAVSLTGEQWHSFLDDYTVLSDRMQMASGIGAAWPIRTWKDEILGKLRGMGRRLLRPVLESMADEDLERNPDRIRTIHGDFHFGNTLFADGRLECCLDLEDLRLGYPAEDIACFCRSAIKRTKWFEWRRRKEMFSFFEQAVRHLPYPAHEWRTAINALFLSNVRRKLAESPRLDWIAVMKLLRYAKMDDRFRAIASEAEGCR